MRLALLEAPLEGLSEVFAGDPRDVARRAGLEPNETHVVVA
ncbi:MAG TPA: hypothetical protein VE615_11600 [Gaiellaceae bacterium]|nr:hypothetical protein [Gaiellaceae bacterium]